MHHKQQMTRMTFDVPITEHKKIKAMAAMMGVSMKEFVLDCVHAQVSKKKIPNALTRKVLKESDEGKNLVRYSSFEEMIEDLGL